MKPVFTFIFSIISIMALAQNGALYVVNVDALNVRKGPGTEYQIQSRLTKGQEVKLIDKLSFNWWKIKISGTEGFVFSSYLSPKVDPFQNWKKIKYLTGSTPEYLNINPRFDPGIENFLRVKVGKNTDVVVKLMKKGKTEELDSCFRIAYINSYDSYDLKHIPQGHYYLKIAYGNDWRQTTENGRLYGRFTKNALYERGEEILSFYKLKKENTVVGDYTYENWEIPSYELFLDVIFAEGQEFDANSISEEDFND